MWAKITKVPNKNPKYRKRFHSSNGILKRQYIRMIWPIIFCSLSNGYFFKMIVTNNRCGVHWFNVMWSCWREGILYMYKMSGVWVRVQITRKISGRNIDFYFNNRPRWTALTTSVTSGRPNKFCQADFKKLISLFKMSMVSSLSDAM